MMMGNLPASCLLFVLTLIPSSGFAPESDENILRHVVLVWLKLAFQTAQYQDDFLKATAGLGNIPQVKSLQYGKAISSERKMLDDSFNVDSMMTFGSQQDMNDYFVHAVHIEFVEQYIQGKAEKVIAYDF